MQKDVFVQDDINNILSKKYPWETLGGKNILITGASGMIGSILANCLIVKSVQYGFSVTVLSRNKEVLDDVFGKYRDFPNFSILAQDIAQGLNGKYSVIFHCASNTHPIQYSTDPVNTITANVIGLNNCFKALQKDGRLVCISSVEIYGVNRGDVEKFSETYCGYIDPNTVRAGYNESKRICESLCQAYKSQYGADFVTARLSRTYGPTLKRDDSKAISQFIWKACSAEDIVLKSKGDQLYSYCYSADAADSLLFLYFYGKNGEAYNICGKDSDWTLREIAEYLAKLSDRKVILEQPDETESNGYSKSNLALLDPAKITNLGWKPRYDMKTGLTRTFSALSGEDRS